MPRTLCLWGDLGSGKTTFAKGLARGLGITARMLSPTFIIVRHYPISANESVLYHWDLYRTNSRHDLEGLGLSDVINDPYAISVIEWPERLGEALPVRRIDLRFVTRPDEFHEIEGKII